MIFEVEKWILKIEKSVFLPLSRIDPIKNGHIQGLKSSLAVHPIILRFKIRQLLKPWNENTWPSDLLEIDSMKNFHQKFKAHPIQLFFGRYKKSEK